MSKFDVYTRVTESSIEDYFCRRIKEEGAFQYKNNPAWFRGVPDRSVLYKGRMFFVELKRPEGGVISTVQKAVAAILNTHGFPVYYISTKAEVEVFIKHIMK